MAPPASIDALVRSHQRGVYRFLRALGANAALAEELGQDAFLIAWRKGLVGADEAAARAWLVRTARFLWLRQLRTRQREEARSSAPLLEWWLAQPEPDPSESLLRALAECRALLAPRAARALELLYAEGTPRVDAAAALGLRENGLKTLLQRTRAWLRDCMQRRLS